MIYDDIMKLTLKSRCIRMFPSTTAQAIWGNPRKTSQKAQHATPMETGGQRPEAEFSLERGQNPQPFMAEEKRALGQDQPALWARIDAKGSRGVQVARKGPCPGGCPLGLGDSNRHNWDQLQPEGTSPLPGKNRGLLGTQNIFHLTLMGLQSHVTTVLFKKNFYISFAFSLSPQPELEK